MWLAYMLPSARIEEHVKTSALVFQKEGTYPVLTEYASSQLDNWTDALMLNEASCTAAEKGKALITAMENPYGVIGKETPAEVLADHFLNGTPYERLKPYPRYWHGYQVFLRPLLEILTYLGIRRLNGVLQLTLFFCTCLMLVKRGRAGYLLPWILGYLMLMPPALAKCLQFSACFYIYMTASLALLLLKPEDSFRKWRWLVFLYAGIAAAFFDVLTYPIATFGVPMLVSLMLSGEQMTKQHPCLDRLADIIRCGLLWCAGYGGMWASKWWIAGIVTGIDVYEDAKNTLQIRTSAAPADGALHFQICSCLLKNYGTFLYTPVGFLAAALLLYLLFRILMYVLRGRRVPAAVITAAAVPYLLTGLAPTVWFVFAINHSSIHFWFTGKACVVSLLAVLFALTDFLHRVSRE